MSEDRNWVSIHIYTAIYSKWLWHLTNKKSTQTTNALCAFCFLKVLSFHQASHIIFKVSASDLD